MMFLDGYGDSYSYGTGRGYGFGNGFGFGNGSENPYCTRLLTSDTGLEFYLGQRLLISK